jgi:hypothetical protein
MPDERFVFGVDNLLSPANIPLPYQVPAAAKTTQLQQEKIHEVLQEALQFIESSTRADSFYTGLSLLESVDRRIAKIGPPLPEPVDSADVELPFNTADAMYAGGRTEMAKISLLKYKVLATIKQLREATAPAPAPAKP